MEIKWKTKKTLNPKARKERKNKNKEWIGQAENKEQDGRLTPKEIKLKEKLNAI